LALDALIAWFGAERHLYAFARALSDVQAAEELNEAGAALFERVPSRGIW
jgi:hypothetical protein